MTKKFLTTGSNGQQDRVIEFNADEFAEKFANVIHEHVTKAIEPALARIAELEKRQQAANGRSVNNKFKLPSAEEQGADAMAKREIPGIKSSFKLPKGD